MEQNIFIAFEDIDGSGKSTHARRLSASLSKDGHKVYATSEPTDSHVGLMIRDIFRNKTDTDHMIIAGLFVADRLDHLLNKTNGILKKMEEGFTVVSDRYYFSSYAYQGAHIDINRVIQANALSVDILRPDINIFIDVSPEICIRRLRDYRTSTELYETLDNLKIVREKYLEAFEKLKGEENVFITNGDRPVEEVANDTRKCVSSSRANCKWLDESIEY